MNKNTTPIVDAVGKIKLHGRIIPSIWYKTIVRPNGTPDDAAIKILADLFYWYTPTFIYDEHTSELITIKKKFAGDKVHKNYERWGDAFGLSKRQVSDAVSFLVSAEVITREIRSAVIDGQAVGGGICYLEIVPSAIDQLNSGIVLEYNEIPGERIKSDGSKEPKITYNVKPISDSKTVLDFTQRGTPPSRYNVTPPTSQRDNTLIDYNTDNKKESYDSYTAPSAPSRGSARSSSEIPKKSNPEKRENTPEKERKEWGCTAAAWQRYAGVVHGWNSRFKNMSRLTFPKDFDPEGPNYVSVSGATKTLKKIVDFIDQTTQGKFLGMHPINRDELKKKFPVVYGMLTHEVIISVEDITEALKLHQEFFTEGNWPEDKKKVPKDIATWICHPQTKFSWFVKCLEMVKTGDRSHDTGVTELERRAVSAIVDYQEWFEEPLQELINCFTDWWGWMRRLIAATEMRKGYDGRDLTAELGSRPENAWHWIEDYIKHVIEHMDSQTIRGNVLRGKSRWAVNFVRQYAREHEEQDWDLGYDEYDKEQ